MLDVNWEFDAKDYSTETYGNFSSPTIMKLVSKYNKSTLSKGKEANAAKVAITIADALNEKLNSGNDDN